LCTRERFSIPCLFALSLHFILTLALVLTFLSFSHFFWYFVGSSVLICLLLASLVDVLVDWFWLSGWLVRFPMLLSRRCEPVCPLV